MNVALVYDRVNSWGGAERVLLALHKIWPDAPLYTAVYEPTKAAWSDVFKVRVSFLNKIPLIRKRHDIFPWLMPLAFESFDFSEFDVVISVTSAEAKGIITKPKTLHICYCLTPTRYLWSGYHYYFKKRLLTMLAKPVISYLRRWDKVASQRPDVYLSISRNVQQRITQYYQRDSKVIYPPLDTSWWKPGDTSLEDYFLVVSRLVYYKRTDMVIRAFNQLGLPLKIIGTGAELPRLKDRANKNISFLGQLTDNELLGYYQKCKAVIFPQEEDFGLVPLEAQACGRPVIALRAGGGLETVIEGKSGVFFYPQTVRALKQAVLKFDASFFDPKECQNNAQKFTEERFLKTFKSFIDKKWKNFLS